MEEFKKEIYLLREIYISKNEIDIVEIINNSQIGYTQHWDYSISSIAFSFEFKLLPTLYTKNFNSIKSISNNLKTVFNQISQSKIESIIIQPNYDKIEIFNSEISTIITIWEEINQLQNKLIEDMKKSNQEIDYQNIGNTCRTIMDKLARAVFDSNIHKSEKKDVDLSNGKFKNQFHTYIAFKLKGSSNQELRLFASSSIEFTEKAIDLMNQTVHKLDVKKHFAEVCVISTISVISLIKAINEI